MYHFECIPQKNEDKKKTSLNPPKRAPERNKSEGSGQRGRARGAPPEPRHRADQRGLQSGKLRGARLPLGPLSERGMSTGLPLMWVDEILHRFETMGSQYVLAFTGGKQSRVS